MLFDSIVECSQKKCKSRKFCFLHILLILARVGELITRVPSASRSLFIPGMFIQSLCVIAHWSRFCHGVACMFCIHCHLPQEAILLDNIGLVTHQIGYWRNPWRGIGSVLTCFAQFQNSPLAHRCLIRPVCYSHYRLPTNVRILWFPSARLRVRIEQK